MQNCIHKLPSNLLPLWYHTWNLPFASHLPWWSQWVVGSYWWVKGCWTVASPGSWWYSLETFKQWHSYVLFPVCGWVYVWITWICGGLGKNRNCFGTDSTSHYVTRSSLTCSLPTKSIPNSRHALLSIFAMIRSSKNTTRRPRGRLLCSSIPNEELLTIWDLLVSIAQSAYTLSFEIAHFPLPKDYIIIQALEYPITLFSLF